ncbi:MAG: helix-turn-helix domain-containing protein [Betaproteobacteria bacterium]
MAKKNPSSPSIPPAPPAPTPGAMPQLVFLASPAELGRAVRAARLARNLTQEDLADRARVSRKFVNQLEEGKASAHLGKVLTVMMSVGLVGVVVPLEAMQAAMG